MTDESPRAAVTNHLRVRRERAWDCLLALLAAVGCLGTVLAFWPGFISTYDALYQLDQAVGRRPLTDWHPPVMSLLWRALIWLTGTPASMAALQAVMFWSSLLVIAWALWRLTGSRWGSLAVLGLGLTPQVFMEVAVVWKDVPMAFAFLATAAVAIAGPLVRSRPATLRWALFGVGLVFLVYAILVRKNAIFAALPIFAMLVLALFPRPSRRTWLTASAALVAGLVVSTLAISVLARPGHTNQVSQVELDDLLHVLSVDELRSADVSPDLRRHLVTAAAACDRAGALSNTYWWCYGKGAHGPYTAVAHTDQIQSLWLREIPRHLPGYLEYRTQVFSRLLFETEPEYPGPMIPNDQGLRFSHPRAVDTLQTYVEGVGHDLPWLYACWFWLLVGVVLSLRPGRGTLAVQIRMLGLSSVTYVLGYFPILPVPVYRYIYWSALAAGLALLLFVVDRGRGKPATRGGDAAAAARPVPARSDANGSGEVMSVARR